MLMNAVYHSTDLFAPALGVSVVSLFKNNKASVSVDIYIIENQISNVEALMRIWKIKGKMRKLQQP